MSDSVHDGRAIPLDLFLFSGMLSANEGEPERVVASQQIQSRREQSHGNPHPGMLDHGARAHSS
jgi:hypothetical protein